MTSKIVIVGSGIIGRSWAVLFASSGRKVVMHDVSSHQIEEAQLAIPHLLQEYVKMGVLRGKLSAEEQQALITYTTAGLTGDTLGDAEAVVECVPERLEMKQEVFRTLDDLVSPQCLLMSSSSCIPCSKFTEDLKHRENCVVTHPVNPLYLIPLVEIVPSQWTSKKTVEKAKLLLECHALSPVVLNKELFGFALNRIQYAIINEAFKLVADGVLTPEDVDKTVTCGLGTRYAFYGPFEIGQLNAHGVIDYFNRYSPVMHSVSDEMGFPCNYEQETLEQIANYTNSAIPVDHLDLECNRRDHLLAELGKLKKKYKP